MNVIFLISVLLSIILESHFCLAKNETCTFKSSTTTTETSESSVTVTENKTCTSESSSTTETPTEPEYNEASVLEGATFYFNETGHLICCSHCRQDHIDDFPRVEFDLADGINKLKKKFRDCCCLITRRRKCTTTEKPKPKGPPKSCGQMIKKALSKVAEEINKPLYVPPVCRCICHKYAI